MVAPKNQIIGQVDSETYPLGEKSEHVTDGSVMALLALSHTAVEHRLYTAMLTTINGNGNDAEHFTARRLISLTGIASLSTVRRGLEGLVAKLSVTRNDRYLRTDKGEGDKNGDRARELGATYRVYLPDEVLARRQALGQKFFVGQTAEINHSFERVISKLVENSNLSRREAQVALCCVEGLTNAEIGTRLQVSEQTVKFHLRHVFIKFGVKRRAELISRLLM